jgi:hypothetical protein
LIENGPDILSEPFAMTAFLWALSAWMGDPAVLTAIASLLTAIAAFVRTRHRPSGEPSPMRTAEPLETPLSRAYETLHAVEEKIREELLLQLQNLQEEAEVIGRDLAAYQQANTALRDMILRCAETECPARGALLDRR